MKAIVSSKVCLPVEAVDASTVMHDLTVRQFVMGEKEPVFVRAYEKTRKWLCVPRSFGLQLIAKLGLQIDNRMSAGRAVKFPKKAKHEGEYAYQQDFVDRILAASEQHTDFLVQAVTGSGKTVCALSVIEKRGRSALVIVDQDNLLQQWLMQAKRVLGLRGDQIGIVQGDRCDYEGKPLVIAMMQSLTRREYPEGLYDAFGTVVFDEAHVAGAPTFSLALMMFSAEVRFGVSATIERRDELQKILHWNLGEVAVELLDKHDKSYVYYLESDTVYSWYANISPKVGRILSEVSEDATRNLLIVEAVRWLYGHGRDVLIIGDRIEQLQNLMTMCQFSGIPENKMGLFCGFRGVWKFTKEATPKRRPVGYVKGTEYTPVSLQYVRKKIPRKELDSVKENATLIFATFGMLSKGVDIPRLSAGVDCTPRSRAEQTHGRILRKLEGKFVPIWVTIRDFNSYRLDYQFLQRIDEYVASSAEIYQWKLEKDAVRLRDVKELKREVRQNVKELKDLNITMCADGNYTLITPPTLTR